MCIKVKYLTSIDAWRGVAKLCYIDKPEIPETVDSFDVYKCPKCNHFHFGHKLRYPRKKTEWKPGTGIGPYRFRRAARCNA